jgi:hypothetical protein
MTIAKYIASIERNIAEQQQVQMVNRPDSAPWRAASSEIHRLAALIIEAQHGGSVD